MAERRKVPRYPFGVRASLHEAAGGAGVTVQVRVISTLGCELESTPGPNIGKKCELYLDWRGIHLGLEGQVVSRSANGRTGLEFLSVDAEMYQRLSKVCALLRSEAKAALQPAEAAKPSAGLRFSPGGGSASSSAVAGAPPKQERRRVPRYVSELRAHLLNAATGLDSRVALITLSVLGGCVEGSGLPDLGQKCELRVCDFFEYAHKGALKIKGLTTSKRPETEKSHKLSAQNGMESLCASRRRLFGRRRTNWD